MTLTERDRGNPLLPGIGTRPNMHFGSRRLVAVAVLGCGLYTALFLARVPSWWPVRLRGALEAPARIIHQAIAKSSGYATGGIGSLEFRSGVYLLVVAGVLPWMFAAFLGRGHPYSLGFRMPNRLAWRVILIGYLFSLPLLWWMTADPKFPPYYLRQLERAGVVAFLLYYFVNMLTEHFFFHGVILALCRPGGRWPAPPPIAQDARHRIRLWLQWFGLDQPTGGARGVRRLSAWLGLPEACWVAIVTSAILFAVVHVGKNSRELLLSFPGAVAQAFLAYRTNSWLTPWLLHMGTAGTALLIVVLNR